jgi:hypothetical protein
MKYNVCERISNLFLRSEKLEVFTEKKIKFSSFSSGRREGDIKEGGCEGIVL